MRPMKPLLDSEMPEDLASVLRSAEADGLEHGPAEARTLAAVAVHRAARSNAHERRGSTGTALAKMTLVLAVACAGGAALFSTFGSSAPSGAELTPASAPSAPASSASPSAPSMPSAALAPAPASPEGVRIDDLPVARATRTTAPSAGRGNRSEVELEDGLALIDSARAALAAKRPASTLASVEAYRRRFRGGHFEEEADVLEIQALVAMGRRDEAKTKGERYLASHPGSAYERRVQSALASEVTP
ncbi:MAG: hypothetical protein K0S65_4330 [Labilithrix sp.]|nr:hypothetical protein [Labilithrix sp.]